MKRLRCYQITTNLGRGRLLHLPRLTVVPLPPFRLKRGVECFTNLWPHACIYNESISIDQHILKLSPSPLKPIVRGNLKGEILRWRYPN